MSNRSVLDGGKSTVRLEGSIKFIWVIALGSSLLIGFYLFPFQVGERLVEATVVLRSYFLAIFVYLLLLFTFKARESTIRTDSGSGFFDLLHPGRPNLVSFCGSCLLLIGYVFLVALLGRVSGAYLGILLNRLFDVYYQINSLSLIILSLTALNFLVGGSSLGNIRTNIIYAGIAVGMIVLGWVLINDSDPSQAKNLITTIEWEWELVALLSIPLWGASLILDYRKRVPQKKRNLTTSMIVSFLIGIILGIITVLAKWYPTIFIGNLGVRGIVLPANLPKSLEIAFIIAGLMMYVIAMVGVLGSSGHLLDAMNSKGYFPWGYKGRNNTKRSVITLLLIFLISAIVLWLVEDTTILMGIAGLSFLWISAFINIGGLRSLTQDVHKPTFRLPFQPLFPVIAIVICLFLSFQISNNIWIIGLIFIAIAGLYYVTVLRTRLPAIREIGDTSMDVATKFEVLVPVLNPHTAIDLIQAGARIAQSRSGRLIVLQVLKMADYLPEDYQREEAHQQLNVIEDYISSANISSIVPVTPIVRIANSTTSGIINTIQEETAELLLLAWQDDQRASSMDWVWSRLVDEDEVEDPQSGVSQDHTDDHSNMMIYKILREAPCEVAILRGKYPERVQQILAILERERGMNQVETFGKKLVVQENGQLLIFQTEPNITTNNIWPSFRKEKSIKEGVHIDRRHVEPDQLEREVLRQAANSDLLILNLGSSNILEEDRISNFARDLSRRSPCATITLRPAWRWYEFWFRKIWSAIQAAIRPLSAEDRAEVDTQMRKAAQPNVNFFVLITLAATIATLGLLLDSTAIIIGAMLVAPLMSPIVSLAMGIVEVDFDLIRIAAEAAGKGILVAIVIALLVTIVATAIIAPAPINTNEIYGRTNPNLLDLVVALASGAAAGYALSRREVGAALPGIAIAVALVPPLCVVGYGIAVEDFDISTGALLLFMTNVVAIVLAAGFVFLMLGFRPQTKQQPRYQRGFTISVISLVLVAIVLGLFLNISQNNNASELELRNIGQNVETILKEEIPSESGQLSTVFVEESGSYTYEVNVVVLAYDKFDDDTMAEWERTLNEKLKIRSGLNVELKVIQLEASFSDP